MDAVEQPRGTLRPLSDRFPEPFDAASQIWLRRDAASPWEVDVPITPDRDGLWTSKRWDAHVAPVEEVTWVADDGIRYLRPEITLHFKARFCRPKDERDLEVTWPLLTEDQRAWLHEAITATEGREHPWLAPYAVTVMDRSAPSTSTTPPPHRWCPRRSRR